MTSSLVDGSHAGEAYCSVGRMSPVDLLYIIRIQGSLMLWLLLRQNEHVSLVHSMRLHLKNPRGCYCANMSMSEEVIADVHSKVLSTIHYFERMPVELVFIPSLSVCVD